MARAGARAYNGERGSRGQAPVGGSTEDFVFKTVICNASATVLHEMMYCLSCFFCKVSK